jgi:hypothetical protein
MNKADLSQAVQYFNVKPLSNNQVLTMLQDRAKLIKPLLKQTTLERLGSLPAYLPGDSFNPKIWDCELHKSKRMLNIQTEGIFGSCYTPIQLESSIPEQGVSEFWGLCRDSQWCYGKIEFIKSRDFNIDLSTIDFYHLELKNLLELWPTWQDIWSRLGEFVLVDKERVEKRYQLIHGMATRIEIENALAQNAMQNA